MGKEPLIVSLTRLTLVAGVVIFLALLYWSSLILEENSLKTLSDLDTIQETLHFIESKVEQVPSLDPIEPTIKQTKAEADLPNLLLKDPFYEKTLPSLLGPDFSHRGTRKEVSLGKPHHLHPFSNWTHISAWINLCTVGVSSQHFGIYDSYAPDMAIKVEERKNEQTQKTEFWIFLRDQVYWQPLQQKFFGSSPILAHHFLKKHKVTAHDFKFYFDAVMNPYVQEPGAIALRTYLVDIDEFRIVDDLTFVIRWKTKEFPEGPKQKYIATSSTMALRPLASFVYQYFPDGTKIIADDSDPNTYRTNSIWAQNFSRHWASSVIPSCGAWVFDGMTDQLIRFKRNPDHYSPLEALVEVIEYVFKDSIDAAWQAFKAAEFDDFFIPPNQLLELENFLQSEPYRAQSQQGLAIKKIEYFNRSFVYVGWNETRPFFQSKIIRKALTMAIDRKRIIRQNLNGMGVEINGPFFIHSKAYDSDIQPWPYDPMQAKLLLEEEGWFDSDGDGIIDKIIDGKSVPFRFSLTYYVRNPTTKSICEYISTALKEVGIECHLNGVDIADLSAAFDEKNFDALYLGWAQGAPPEDPKQIWFSVGAKEKGSSNAIGFSNSEVDKIIEALEYESSPEKRTALYHHFDAIIHDEVPYTFLFTQKTMLIYRDFLKNVFIPAERQDLIPGADVESPQSSIFWIQKNHENP